MRIEKVQQQPNRNHKPDSFIPRIRSAPTPQGLDVLDVRDGLRPLRIALVVPQFEPHIDGHDYMLPLLPGDVRACTAGEALPLLAALVGPAHHVEIFDENVESIDWEYLSRFDVVGLTGMLVQRRRLQVLLGILADHPGVVAVGGPYASVDETFFNGLCDVLFVGEADQTWPVFIDSLARDTPVAARYEQIDRTDLASLPVPRYDLLKAKHYRTASAQFSRGCPFMCEFCDIITIYGRKARTKSPAQVIAALDALNALGFREVLLVDDNFIGNKRLAKEFLHQLIAWQEANGFPLQLRTEATVNLGDEAELLELMYRANFVAVFIGIESPNMDSLLETKKVQNVRGDSPEIRIARIRDAGLIVSGGCMLGFDHDGPDIFDLQFDSITRMGIARVGVSILTAIPTTPLYDRLETEGRLRLESANCNFVPKGMSARELRDGYLDLTRRLYDPDAYLGRVFDSWASSEGFRRRWAVRKRRSRQLGLVGRLRALAIAGVIASRLARALVADGELARIGVAYLRIYRRYRRNGVPGIGPLQYVQFIALHWHCYKYYKEARLGNLEIFNAYAYSSSASDGPRKANVVTSIGPQREVAPAHETR